MKWSIWLLLVVILAGFASAQIKQIPILSVSQHNDSLGGVADVYLEVQPGQGRVYFDSYPLTRLDTQLSTRFAKEYACQLSSRNCNELDFFYVIRVNSALVGGPSAGAALTVLTYATLEDLSIKKDVVMTGTVTSAGIVGPVGGTIAKIAAASNRNFSKALISSLEESNASVSHEDIQVIPVDDVEAAIFHFTGKDVQQVPQETIVPIEYENRMREVSQILCQRANDLAINLDNISNVTKDFLVLADQALLDDHQYTAASYCFSALLGLREQDFSLKSPEELRRIYRALEQDIENLDIEMSQDVKTVANLEVFMIVRERLVDAQSRLVFEEYENITSYGLAYVYERLHSAVVWSSFFDTIPSELVDLSDEQLKRSCFEKISEAEQRANFLTQLLDLPLDDTRDELDKAYEYRLQGEWALCLFTAAKAKAETEAVINAAYAGERLNESVELKQRKVQNTIARQTAEHAFPILSYAYSQYAKDLESIYSKSLYTEYAIELASLDIYFPAKTARLPFDKTKIWLLVAGLIMGLSIGVLCTELVHRTKSRKKRKKR